MSVSQVYQTDKRTLAKVQALLERVDITLDEHLDYTCAIFDEEGNVIATGCVVACGRLIGAGKSEEANRSFHSCFTLCLIAGGAVAGLLHVEKDDRRRLAHRVAESAVFRLLTLGQDLLGIDPGMAFPDPAGAFLRDGEQGILPSLFHVGFLTSIR